MSRVCVIVGLVTLTIGATAPLGGGVVAARHAIESSGQRIDVGVALDAAIQASDGTLTGESMIDAAAGALGLAG
jgi:hypothetical protein